ncbi:MAG: primosomal protein N' [Trueperaceae bacterium]|nr:primosomal protein N' [Trueperaceae bacterium]
MPRALDVWLPLPVPPLLFLAPVSRAGQEGPVVAGVRVAVPWQGGVRVGVVAQVVEIGAAKALELKEAIAVLDHDPWVLEPARRMIAAQAARAVASPGVALATMLAAGVHDELLHELRRVPGVEPEALGEHGEVLADDAWIDADLVPRDAVTLWREHGLVHERVRASPVLVRVLEPRRGADEALEGKARANQRTALAHLERLGSVASGAELARDADVPESAVRALVTKGYAAYEDVEVPPPPPCWAVAGEGPTLLPPGVWPSGEGRVLVSGGRARDRLAWLLAAATAEIAAGAQVLVLASELAAVALLAPELARVAPTLVVRGDLDARVRESGWREAARGEPLVVVGTYQALSMPLPTLSRVLVWDAASPSYKLPAGTRSVARRDAEVLADAAHAGIAWFDAVATPELRATRPTRTIHERVPSMRLVTSDLRASTTWPLGGDLIRTLKQVAERGRQALLIVPRRGFAAGLACRACGTSVMCPNCDLPLRWHARVERLRCHQCGVERPAPPQCPTCGATGLEPLHGAGTEWVAREVERVVAPLAVHVVDTDHRADLAPLYDGAAGVVVATTAVLRSAPLPNLSLVALTLGDALYAREDFRADEGALRTMLALADLAGDRRPLVLVQTFDPEHALWTALAADDPDAAVVAYADELDARRRRFGYPPAQQWARLQITHRDEATARRAAVALAATLRTAGIDERALLGPAPAGVARLRGRYAQQLFVRAVDDVVLATALEGVDTRPGEGVRVRVDVDPYDVAVWLE